MRDTPLPENDKLLNDNYKRLPDDMDFAWLWLFCPPGFPFVTDVPWIKDRVWKYDS